MSVVYQTSLNEVLKAATNVLEVDGVPVSWGDGDYNRVGMFSIKQDTGGDCAFASSEWFRRLEIDWFANTSPIRPEAFHSYDEARFWSHP